MVKIIGICGSPRRKSSYAALREALDGALETGDVEVELIELRARKLNFCIHCNKCLREDAVRCTVYEDDMTPLYEKVYQADGMIIASPVYEMNITFRPTWNIIKKDPTFFNRKVGAAIAVGGTRNGGQEGALNAILGFYHTQGMVVCNGGAGTYAGASLWNPGDGSGEMDDPEGLKRARALGAKMADLTKRLNLDN